VAVGAGRARRRTRTLSGRKCFGSPSLRTLTSSGNTSDTPSPSAPDWTGSFARNVGVRRGPPPPSRTAFPRRGVGSPPDAHPQYGLDPSPTGAATHDDKGARALACAHRAVRSPIRMYLNVAEQILIDPRPKGIGTGTSDTYSSRAFRTVRRVHRRRPMPFAREKRWARSLPHGAGARFYPHGLVSVLRQIIVGLPLLGLASF